MTRLLKIALLALDLLVAALAQTPGKTEFEAASIKTNEPQTGFHFAADAVSGGPGTAGPGMFRCSRCSLATLIAKAFNLQPYQFPGRAALTGTTYEVSAKVPVGATAEQFSAMLQNLLKERFSLAYHFQEKKMKGYRLVVSKDGPKLKESNGVSSASPAERHGSAPSESHSHSGAMSFGSSTMYHAANQTTADLARVLSDQIGLPVDDETGLTGRYDISLRWSGTGDGTEHSHNDGGYSGGGGGYAGHDSGAAPGGASGDSSGPALFDALQQQLGLKLVAADQAVTRLFVVDRVSQRPTEN